MMKLQRVAKIKKKPMSKSRFVIKPNYGSLRL